MAGDFECSTGEPINPKSLVFPEISMRGFSFSFVFEFLFLRALSYRLSVSQKLKKHKLIILYVLIDFVYSVWYTENRKIRWHIIC